MKITVTGDSILLKEIPKDYAAFEEIRDYICQGDVRINNLEMTITRGDCFGSTFCGGMWLTAVPERLDDVLKYGFNCFGFANNHTMDYSFDGLKSTLRELEERKVPVCGAGMSLAEATSHAMVQGDFGKVAVLCISSTCDDAARAGDAHGPIPARPGLNMLRHSETFLVNADHMKALEEIAEVTNINGRINNSKRGGYTLSRPGVFSLGNVDFRLSEEEGKTSAPNKRDVERMQRAIEQAKKEADHVIVCFHSHEIKGEDDEEPDFFIEEFARACIDSGASAVVGSGTHQIKAIELYKGRPIFYSIANFIFEAIACENPFTPQDHLEKYGAPDKTLREVEALRSANFTRGLETEDKNYMGLMPLIEFEGDRLVSIRIKPTELSFYGENPELKGLPHPADEKTTKHIFDTLCRLSAPFGTRLSLDGGIICVDLN